MSRVAMSPARKSPLGATSPGRLEDTMYPGMIGWWKHARRHVASCGEAHCGPFAHGGRGWGGAWAGGEHEGDFGGSFGVRRPLRFLAFKLELDEGQVTELAKILNDLKTERAQ